jgi:hypothetical protein
MATDTMPHSGAGPKAPGRTAPSRTAPSRTAPSRTAPSRTAPSRSGLGRTAPPGPAAEPGSPRTRPVSAPRHTRPISRPAARPATGPDIRQDARPRHPRAPFILLLIGLLGGALVSLLVISTTLAQGSFQITSLQQQNSSLARQEQLLTQEVAQASSPAQIAQEAELLGMQQDPNLRFINLKTRKIVSGKVSRADAEINVPGYNP